MKNHTKFVEHTASEIHSGRDSTLQFSRAIIQQAVEDYRRAKDKRTVSRFTTDREVFQF